MRWPTMQSLTESENRPMRVTESDTHAPRSFDLLSPRRKTVSKGRAGTTVARQVRTGSRSSLLPRLLLSRLPSLLLPRRLLLLLLLGRMLPGSGVSTFHRHLGTRRTCSCIALRHRLRSQSEHLVLQRRLHSRHGSTTLRRRPHRTCNSKIMTSWQRLFQCRLHRL